MRLTYAIYNIYGRNQTVMCTSSCSVRFRYDITEFLVWTPNIIQRMSLHFSNGLYIIRSTKNHSLNKLFFRVAALCN